MVKKYEYCKWISHVYCVVKILDCASYNLEMTESEKYTVFWC